MCRPFTRLLVIAVLFATSCQKGDDTNPDPDKEPANIGGKIYYFTNLKLGSVDLRTSQQFTSSIELNYRYTGRETPLVYDNGLVYQADSYGVDCIDAATGAEKWSTSFATAHYSSTSKKHNTIVIADSLLYITSYVGMFGDHVLNAVHKTTGTIKWQKTIAGMSQCAMSTPVLHGDNIIVSTTSGPWPSEYLDKLICFNRITGNLVWEKTYPYHGGSRPVIRNNTIFTKTLYPTGVLAVNASNGEKLWFTDVPAKAIDDKILLTDNEVVAVFESNDYSQSKYYHLDAATGQLKNAVTRGNFLSWTNTGSSYVILHGKSLAAYDNKTHQQLWEVQPEDIRVGDSLLATHYWAHTDLIHYKDHVLYFAAVAEHGLGTGRAISDIYVYSLKTGKLEKKIPVGKGFAFYVLIPSIVLVDEEKPYTIHLAGNN